VSAPIQIGSRRTSADIAVQVVGRFVNLALGVIVTLVIVRSLGTHGFGAWSTLLAVTQIAANLGELGLGQVAVSRSAAEPERESSWLGALLFLRLLLALPIALASVLAVLLIAPNATARLAGILLSCTLLLAAPSALGAVFQLRVRNDISTALLTLNSVVWAGAVVAVAATSGGIVWFAGAMVAVSALTSVVTVMVALRMTRVHMHGTRELQRTLARVGLTVGAAGIFVTLYVRLDQILVLEFAGVAQAGLYGAAYRILDQVQFIPASVMTTLFPMIASAYPTDLRRVRHLIQTAAEFLTIASLPILAFTVVAAHRIVGLLFGSQFLGATPALPILMGAFVAISFGYLTGSMVIVLGLQRRFLLYAALGLVVNAVLNVLLIPPYGFQAAAWITLATELVVMVLITRDITRTLSMTPRVGRLARTAAAAAVMGIATWLAQRAGVPLLGLVAISGGSYAIAIVVFRVLSPGDVRAILRDDDHGADALGPGAEL
jgi:O-antigen/teichoic acid export membrane protein